MNSVSGQGFLSKVFEAAELTRLEDEYGETALASIACWLEIAAAHGDDVRSDFVQRLKAAIGDRPGLFRVVGELMAAYFFESQLGFNLRHVPRTSMPTPEFDIGLEQLQAVVEVKTITGSLGQGFMGVPRWPSLRGLLKSARRQLDKERANLVVFVDFHYPGIPWDIVQDAVFGDPVLIIPYGEQGPIGEPFVRRKNIRFQPEINTRIGAIAMVHCWDGAKCFGYFIHNPYARKPVAATLLDPWPQFVVNSGRTDMEWRNLDDQNRHLIGLAMRM